MEAPAPGLGRPRLSPPAPTPLLEAQLCPRSPGRAPPPPPPSRQRPSAPRGAGGQAPRALPAQPRARPGLNADTPGAAVLREPRGVGGWGCTPLGLLRVRRLHIGSAGSWILELVQSCPPGSRLPPGGVLCALGAGGAARLSLPQGQGRQLYPGAPWPPAPGTQPWSPMTLRSREQI